MQNFAAFIDSSIIVTEKRLSEVRNFWYLRFILTG
jgi:hypothetical protein